MKFNLEIKLPQKSVLGFKVLNSLQSSLSCYLLLTLGKFLNPLFGSDQLQITASALFNIVLNSSFVILILNLTIKRKQVKKLYFFLLNSFLFFYLPFALYFIVRYLQYLIFVWF